MKKIIEPPSGCSLCREKRGFVGIWWLVYGEKEYSKPLQTLKKKKRYQTALI